MPIRGRMARPDQRGGRGEKQMNVFVHDDVRPHIDRPLVALPP